MSKLAPGLGRVTYIIIVAAVVLPPIFAAKQLERLRARRNPHHRPYTWGYWRGCAGLMLGILGVISVVWLAAAGELDADATWGGVLAFVIWGVPGYFVVKRRKWAWVVSTILSLNPVFWVIDSIYGARRWREFGA